MAKKLTDALMMIIGAPKGGKGHSCPECESSMESDGTCSECGYGEEEEGEEGEMEDEGGDRLMEIRDDLQRLVDKISKMIS
jgi:transcription initiation factor IIE alpha subunit